MDHCGLQAIRQALEDFGAAMRAQGLTACAAARQATHRRIAASRYDRRDEKTKMEAATKIHFPMAGH